MKKIVALAMLVFSVVSYGTTVDIVKNKFVKNKIDSDIAVTKQQLEYAAAQIDSITNDLEKFRAIYNSKKVKRVSVKKVWIHEGQARYQKTIVSTNKFYYIDRLIAALEDETLQKLYKKYVGFDAIEVKKDFEDALVQAESEHKQLVYTMNTNKRQYEKNKAILIKERDNTLKINSENIEKQIAENNRKLRQHVLTGSSSCNCSRCRELREKNEELRLQARMTNIAGDIGRTVASYSDKTEKNLAETLVMQNDASIAKFGLDNAKKAVYEQYKMKFADMFVQNLKNRLETNTEQVKVLTKRYESLIVIKQNPDMLNSDIVNQIYANTLNSAINDAFNIDVSEIEKKKKEEERIRRRHEYEMKKLEIERQREIDILARQEIARQRQEIARQHQEAARRQHELDIIKQLQEKPINININSGLKITNN